MQFTHYIQKIEQLKGYSGVSLVHSLTHPDTEYYKLKLRAPQLIPACSTFSSLLLVLTHNTKNDYTTH